MKAAFKRHTFKGFVRFESLREREQKDLDKDVRSIAKAWGVGVKGRVNYYCNDSHEDAITQKLVARGWMCTL